MRKGIIYSFILLMLFLLSCVHHHRFDHLRDYEAKNDEDALIDVLIDDKDGYIRAQAAKSLGRLKSKKAVPALIDGIRDKDWMVRYFCVQSLGIIKDNRAINPLNTQRGVENDENVFMEIDKAINNIKGSSKEAEK